MQILNRRQLRDFDYGILFVTLAIAVIGILMIHSATFEGDGITSTLVKKQVVWALAGLLAMGIGILISQDTLEGLAPFLYGIALILLAAVLIIGVGKMGERRWFEFGPMRLQPSELAKYAVIVVLARYLASRKTNLNRPIHLLLPLIIVLVPTALILREPDLGTSIIFVLILLPMLFWAGVKPIYLLLLAAPVISMIIAFNWIAWAIFVALLGGGLYTSRMFISDKLLIFLTSVAMGRMSPFLWNHLKDYQQHRVLAFLNPEKYRFSTGYQLIQSKIAIGSGSVFGKGFLNGTQKNYAFLPEQHTDFIFSVLAEEFGFFGCVVVIGLYLYIITRMLKLAGLVRNRFAGLVIVGIASALFVQMAVNISVTLGLSPVTGMTLPLLSYGGSSLLVTMGSIGIVLGMSMRRMEY